MDSQDHIRYVVDSKLSRPQRDVAAIAQSVLGLAAFGQSFFNQAQLYQIRESVNVAEVRQHELARKLERESFRITNITNHIQVQHYEVMKTLLKMEKVNRKTVRNLFDVQISLMLHSFRYETGEFLTGLSQLIDGRLSPFLIQPKLLTEAYENLARSAAERGLFPLTMDAGIVFQTQVSVMNYKGNLSCVIHIPLYDGDVYDLYQYRPAPFVINNFTTVVEIKGTEEYLALDQHHVLAKQFNPSQFSACEKFGQIYHCPGMNAVSKVPRSLCLFNLFQQRVQGIEETCQIYLSEVKNHVSQVSASRFRILARDETELVMDCLGGKEVIPIRGVSFVNLTDECPRASTPTHILMRTASLLEVEKLVALPFSNASETWLHGLVDVVRQPSFFSLNEWGAFLPAGPTQLQDLRRSYSERPLRVYRFIEGIVQSLLMFAFLGWAAWKGGGVCIEICTGWLRRLWSGIQDGESGVTNALSLVNLQLPPDEAPGLALVRTLNRRLTLATGNRPLNPNEFASFNDRTFGADSD